MIKRLFDICTSFFGLLAASPILLPVMFLVWWQDKHSPFYIAKRVGKDGKIFFMTKMRSMIIHADKSGVDSTSSSDQRITPVGHFIRKFKIDEITQLWNVLIGDMSLVGPRPNVTRDVDLYTDSEKRLLSAKPGITDFSSIVFSDEGDILKDSSDPDLRYNQIIRPWKSRLGLFYIDHQSLILDISLILLTIVAILNKNKALLGVAWLLEHYNAEKQLVTVARRQQELYPFPPPGAQDVVMSR